MLCFVFHLACLIRINNEVQIFDDRLCSGRQKPEQINNRQEDIIDNQGW